MLGLSLSHGDNAVRGRVKAVVDTVVRFQMMKADATTLLGNTAHPDWGTPDVTVEDSDGTYIAFQEINQADPTNPYDYSATALRTRSSTPGNFPVASQRHSIIWFDLDQIPEGAEIMSAILGVTSGTAADFSDTTYGGLRAVLDVNPEHESWLDGDKWGTDPRRREMSWNNRDQTAGDGWASWGPEESTKWESFGISSPPLNPNLAVGDHLTYDVKEAVQAYVSGKSLGVKNGGFWLINDGKVNTYHIFYCDRISNTSANKNPFLIVTYRNRNKSLPWLGNAIPFCFMTDDQDKDANIVFRAVANGTNVPMSFALRGDAIQDYNGYDDDPLFRKPTPTEITGWLASGSGSYPDLENQVESHTVEHAFDGTDTYGPCVHTTVGEVDADLDPDWVGDDIVGGAQEAKCLIWPGGHWNPEVQIRAALKGYLGARDTGGTPPPNPGYGRAANDGGTYLRWSTLNDLFGIHPTSTTTLVGAEGTDPSSGEVKQAFYEEVMLRIDDDYSAIVVYAHDTKVDTHYSGGIDGDELLYGLQLLTSLGLVWMTTFRSILEFYRATHSPADPPGGSEAEDAGITASDGIWWE